MSSASAPLGSGTPSNRTLSKKERYQVLASVVFGLFMVVLDSTVVNVAFPTLHSDLGAPIATAQWVLSVYVLALGVVAPISGFLGDRFGVKRVYLVGLVVFVLGSVGSGLSPSIGWMIAARALQGVGGGLALPLGTAMLFQTFPKSEQGKALGIFGVAIVLAPAVGPVVGGALVSAGLWRWVFFLNVPIGVVGVWLASRWLVERTSDDPEPLQPLNVALASVGFAATLYAASVASQYGWTSARVLGAGLSGLAALALFAVVDLRSKNPLLRLDFFGRPTFALGNLIMYASAFGVFGGSYVLPIYLQSLRGVSALDTGLLLLPQAAVAAVATPLAGWAFDRVGPRPLLVAGTAILALDNGAFAALGPSTSFVTVGLLLAARGLSFGLISQPAMTAAIGSIPTRDSSRATSTSSAGSYLTQAFAIAVLSTVMASSLSPQARQLDQLYSQKPTAGRAAVPGVCQPGAGDEVGAAVSGAASMAHQKPAHPAALVGELCRERVSGITAGFRIAFWASLLAAVLALFMPGWPKPWDRDDDDPDASDASAGKQPADAAPSGASSAAGGQDA